MTQIGKALVLSGLTIFQRGLPVMGRSRKLSHLESPVKLTAITFLFFIDPDRQILFLSRFGAYRNFDLLLVSSHLG